MGEAFDAASTFIGVSATPATREGVAYRIIDAARRGERDPQATAGGRIKTMAQLGGFNSRNKISPPRFWQGRDRDSMHNGRLIRVSKYRGDPDTMSYIVAIADSAKTIELIRA
jgi:hypothetical protein